MKKKTYSHFELLKTYLVDCITSQD